MDREVWSAIYLTRHQGEPRNRLEHAATSLGYRFYFIVLLHCRFSSKQHAAPTPNYEVLA
jgi:hypothetical protein